MVYGKRLPYTILTHIIKRVKALAYVFVEKVSIYNAQKVLVEFLTYKGRWQSLLVFRVT
jgi:hypothetical protein